MVFLLLIFMQMYWATKWSKAIKTKLQTVGATQDDTSIMAPSKHSLNCAIDGVNEVLMLYYSLVCMY